MGRDVPQVKSCPKLVKVRSGHQMLRGLEVIMNGTSSPVAVEITVQVCQTGTWEQQESLGSGTSVGFTWDICTRATIPSTLRTEWLTVPEVIPSTRVPETVPDVSGHRPVTSLGGK